MVVGKGQETWSFARSLVRIVSLSSSRSASSVCTQFLFSKLPSQKRQNPSIDDTHQDQECTYLSTPFTLHTQPPRSRPVQSSRQKSSRQSFQVGRDEKKKRREEEEVLPPFKKTRSNPLASTFLPNAPSRKRKERHHSFPFPYAHTAAWKEGETKWNHTEMKEEATDLSGKEERGK